MSHDALKRLQMAARRGDLGGIRALLAKGSTANGLGLALLAAAARGQTLATQYLIDCGADPNFFGPSGKRWRVSPLGIAAAQGHLETMRLLLDRGASPGQNRWPHHRGNQDPLCLAAGRSDPAATELLLERGAPINVEESIDFNDFCLHSPALDQAIIQNRCKTAKLLLKHGARREPFFSSSSFREMFFPLLIAIEFGRGTMCRLLLRAGANPWRADADALSRTSPEIVSIISKARTRFPL
jgi:ankyrin repeat protein